MFVELFCAVLRDVVLCNFHGIEGGTSDLSCVLCICDGTGWQELHRGEDQ